MLQNSVKIVFYKPYELHILLGECLCFMPLASGL